MSANNPSVTASDIITDVEARLGTPNISTTSYLPWVSHAYQRTYLALMNTNQRVKEELFGNLATFDLTNGTAEYSLSTNIPRFGGIIKVEILYGGTGDTWKRAKRIDSLANWEIQNNATTTYRSKDNPLFYILKDKIGFIPTPPSTDAGASQAKVWFIRRPYQITDGTDVIDIDYRFIYPIVNFVQARAIEMKNEDYGQAAQVEAAFRRDLEEIAIMASAEFDENDNTNSVGLSSHSALFDNPFR